METFQTITEVCSDLIRLKTVAAPSSEETEQV